MKITFIRCTTNAVGEYRIRHPMMALREQGHDCELFTLGKEATRVSNAELMADVLVLGRLTHPGVFDLLATLPAGTRPKVVYEIDDNPWEWHSWDPIHTELGAGYAKGVSDVMRRCDAVTCSTRTLATRIRREFPAMPIWVVPNAIDYQLRDWTTCEDRAAHGLEGKQVLGWTGSVHHTRDGKAMLEALPTIFEMYPETEFLMQCDKSVYYQWTMPLSKRYGDRLRWVPPLAFGQHPTVYSLFDINLAPLEGTKFNTCKSDLRLIEGGAHGVPYVASKIAPYQEFHSHSGAIGGFIADSPTSWVDGIAELLDGQMEARGESIRRYVRETRALSVIAGQWAGAYQDVLTGSEGDAVTVAEEAGRNAPCPCGSGRKTKRCCQMAYA